MSAYPTLDSLDDLTWSAMNRAWRLDLDPVRAPELGQFYGRTARYSTVDPYASEDDIFVSRSPDFKSERPSIHEYRAHHRAQYKRAGSGAGHWLLRVPARRAGIRCDHHGRRDRETDLGSRPP